MNVRQTPEVEKRIRQLWERFLLAGICNDLMLGEVEDHLFLEHIETPPDRTVVPGQPDPLIDEVTGCGFADDIRDAVCDLYYGEKEILPYAELASRWDGEALMETLFDEMTRHIHVYDTRIITDNPYYQKVKPQAGQAGAITLAPRDTIPYEFFQPYHQTYDREDPFFYAELGVFTERVEFPVLLENGNVWMSVVVSEIESMADAIAEAHGKVITYGLGLGYYAFMAAEKDNVESVTVIEKNPDVIRLFTESILPFFPHKEKIQIIEADALEFVKAQEDGAYDYAFSDFWGGYYDGVDLYMQFMPLTARFSRTKHNYWIESCFMEYFFRPVFMRLLMEKGLGQRVKLPERSREVRALQDEFFRYMETQPLSIASADDIDRLLTPEEVTRWMRQFAVARSRK